MITHSSKSNCHSNFYFEQPAEKLVLQGYRYWTYGWTNYFETHLTKGWALYLELIENECHAREVLDALSFFVKVLDKCASRCADVAGVAERYAPNAMQRHFVHLITNFNRSLRERSTNYWFHLYQSINKIF